MTHNEYINNLIKADKLKHTIDQSIQFGFNIGSKKLGKEKIVLITGGAKRIGKELVVGMSKSAEKYKYIYRYPIISKHIA